MANPADVARLRRLTDEPTAEVYSSLALSSMIDGWDGSIEAAAAEVWREKAARYSGLVDMSEGSSTRKLSQLRDSALKMATSYAEASGTGGTIAPVGDDRPFSRPITRG